MKKTLIATTIVFVALLLSGCTNQIPKTNTPVYSIYPGTYTSAQSLEITCPTDGASIYYTTDGSWPSASSNLYSEPIQISSDINFYAIAIKNGFEDSGVAWAGYVIDFPDTSMPEFSLQSGTYSSDQSVEISCDTDGASIYYTIDGSWPSTSSTLYTEPIQVSSSITLKAKAIKNGFDDSSVSSANYSFKAASPEFNLPPGTYTSAQNIEISCNTDGASIYYTIDGSLPSTSSTLYTEPIQVSSYTHLCAIAVKNGFADSNVVSERYQFNLPNTTMPTFSIHPGTYYNIQSVEIACTTDGACIYYTTDGSNPTTSSTLYTKPIQISSNYANLRAIAIRYGFNNSEIASAVYYLKTASPILSVQSGTYTSVQNIAITCNTKESEIYYTTDGSNPSSSSMLYTEPIQLSSDTYLRAIAIRNGFTPSDISSANFNFKENYSSSDYAAEGSPSVLTISSTYNSIDFYAFAKTGLSEISIPDSIQKIEAKAFEDCTELSKVTLSNSITRIEALTFLNCKKLSNIIIPNKVTHIGSFAFGDCTGLKSITIPASVTSIDKSSFSGCAPLSFSNQSSVIVNLSFPNRIYEEMESPAEYSIPDFYTDIGYQAFYDCVRLKTITIPSSITSISDLAFNGCTSLTNIIIPDSVKTVGMATFANCTNLEIATLSNKLTNIGSSAFRNCKKLTSIIIPDTVEKIGEGAFQGCSALENLKISSKITNIEPYTFWDCKFSTVSIPHDVTEIGKYAFYFCTSLKSITIPAKVISIGVSAFDYCENLSTIVFEGTKSQWEDIGKGADWNKKVPASSVLCSDGTVTL